MSSGYSVQVAIDAIQAIAVIRALYCSSDAAPDVLLTDLHMPGIQGVELIKRVRVEKPGMPAVLMIAYGNVLVKNRIRRMERCLYIEKPFTPYTLLMILEHAFSGEGLRNGLLFDAT